MKKKGGEFSCWCYHHNSKLIFFWNLFLTSFNFHSIKTGIEKQNCLIYQNTKTRTNFFRSSKFRRKNKSFHIIKIRIKWNCFSDFSIHLLKKVYCILKSFRGVFLFRFLCYTNHLHLGEHLFLWSIHFQSKWFDRLVMFIFGSSQPSSSG